MTRRGARSVATHLKGVGRGTWKTARGQGPGAHLHWISQASPLKCLATFDALSLQAEYLLRDIWASVMASRLDTNSGAQRDAGGIYGQAARRAPSECPILHRRPRQPF